MQTVPTVASLTSLGLASVAFLTFFGVGIKLSLVDLQQQRLPDAIVLPSLGLVTLLLLASAGSIGDWTRVFQSVASGAALFACYYLLSIASPSGMGGGDVKLAALIGVVLGWVGPLALAAGALWGIALGALWSVGIIAIRRAPLSSPIPFAPFMVLGAWIGIIGEVSLSLSASPG